MPRENIWDLIIKIKDVLFILIPIGLFWGVLMAWGNMPSKIEDCEKTNLAQEEVMHEMKESQHKMQTTQAVIQNDLAYIKETLKDSIEEGRQQRKLITIQLNTINSKLP